MSNTIPHPEDGIDWMFGKNEVHPSLDYADGVVYVNQWLPMKDGSRKCCIITSAKDIYVLGESELPFNISVQPQKIKQRWSSKSINEFKTGKAPSVSVADLFNKLRGIRDYFMDYPIPEYYDYSALWDGGTYFHQLFNAFPEEYMNAIKRAGKTKHLDISSQTAFNAKLVLDPSASTMFRLSHQNRCTILIDEIKHLHPRTEQNLKQMLRGKFQKGILIPRSEEGSRKGKFDVVEYELYSPLAMANIKGVESDLEDRVVRMTLRRTADKVRGNREINPLDPVWQEARDMAYLCLMENAWVVQEYIDLFDQTMDGTISNEILVDTGRYFLKKEVANYNEVEYKESNITGNSIYLPLPSTKLMSRDLLAWKPILVMARLVSEELFKKMLIFAESMCSRKQNEDLSEDFDVQVVKALLEITSNNVKNRVMVEVDRGYFQVNDITQHLKDRYFPNADWVDNQSVGYALKRIEVYDEKRTVHGRKEILLNFKKLDACARSIPLNPDEVRSEYLKESGKLEVEEVDANV